jgi:3-hydroxyisobutyrate dehydrogenase
MISGIRNIGIAGTGRMGTALAVRLLALGNGVSVWNRTLEKTEVAARAGASVSRTAGELAARCDAVITILTNAAAVEAIYLEPDGLLSGSTAGKLFIDMSTVPVDSHQGLAAKVAARGALFLECPVSGTVGPAQEGKLVGFVGGTPEAFARARPLLEQVCRRVELIGPLGSGAKMKLAVNLVLTVFWQALAEALSLVRSVNIEPARLIDLFADSNIGAGILRARGAQIAAALAGQDTGAATFDIDFMRKDMRDMLREAQTLGIALPALAGTLQAFDQASEAGYGGIDGTRYPAYWVGHVSSTAQI